MTADALAAWREASTRLAAAAQGSADDPDEWVEHVADQAVAWLAWEVLHADPTRPFFHRQNDLVTQWGGPNADNVYRHARVEPGRRYRIRGRMHSCQEFLLAVRAGFMHQSVWGTLEQFTATENGIIAGDDFEILLGGDGKGTIPIPDGAVMVSVREYYFDWIAAEPATFTIECLDPDPPAGSSPLALRLDSAMSEIEDSLQFWDDYLDTHRSKRRDNSFAVDPVTVSKGLSNARYEFCFWDLKDDEALLVEADVPTARYWGIQLYRMHTFELVDPWDHISSRNQTQTVRSPDGKLRWVLAHEDPGHANWLDTAGRRSGLCTLRWFWPTSDATPEPKTRLLKLDEVEDVLDDEISWVDPEGRAIEVEGRRDHLRWRFRT